MEKIAKRTCTQIPEAFQDMTGLEAFISAKKPQHLQKKASLEFVPDLTTLTKVAMGTSEADYIINNTVSLGGIYKSAQGHMWRVAEIDGAEYIILDEEGTQDGMAIQDLVRGASN